jgi:toxin ParE1/3/4
VIHPHLGRATELSNPFLSGTRMFSLKNFDQHVVFYRVIQTGVEIMRVIHGSRDLDTLMDS